jgi:hypothetical protein
MEDCIAYTVANERKSSNDHITPDWHLDEGSIVRYFEAGSLYFKLPRVGHGIVDVHRRRYFIFILWLLSLPFHPCMLDMQVHYGV